MDDLKVNYAGISLDNPLMLASATPGWDAKRLREAAKAGFGAVIPKTIGPPAEWAQHPRCGRMRIMRTGKTATGMINLELFTTKTKDEWIERDLRELREGAGPARIVASILAMPDPEDTARLAQEVTETGCADMLELNVSCPMPTATVGMHIGKDPRLTATQVEAVKSASPLPLAVKLTPNVSDLITVSLAAVEAGAEGLAISNSVRAFAGVDVETGRPYLPAFGGYTGPAIKPIIQRLIIEVLRSGIKVPIAAVGGVSTWRDIVEYIMIGATVVQVASVVMWSGWQVVPRLLEGLRKFMADHGYRSLDDFRGVALPHVQTIEEYSRRPRKRIVLDEDRCTRCGLCLRVCFYDALLEEAPNVKTDPEACDGCGLCVEICPVGALRLE